MKRSLVFCSCALVISTTLMALPEQGQVVSGQVEFQETNANSLTIKASDKSIINYPTFNINEGERVQFVQPSPTSTVLNRITGQDPSKILGELNANGRVFLVNPNGIYFGPKASVNAGSFLASTLNIRDEDFINDKFRFSQDPQTTYASIVNEGTISSPEGFIAFLAPVIANRGKVLARTGKVLLASAEKVTLDFTGDGLIQFAVDGELKQALIENYGQIEAAQGSVAISLQTARDAIKMVVNTDGMKPATAIEESNGVIRLLHTSHIAAKEVHVEGTCVEAQGSIVAHEEKGGTVHLLGDQVSVKNAHIDTSGERGGGTLLIGGDYQGKGDVRNATFTSVDKDTTIYADAKREGQGGKVIVWADDTTLFNGKIYARGGSKGGDGGFVETSGKENLQVGETGYVCTSAAQGNYGDWLLDPAAIVVGTGSGTLTQAANCTSTGTVTISPTTLAGATSNISLCAKNAAGSSITVTSAISLTRSGIAITFSAGSGNAGNINISNNIATTGGALTFNGLVVLNAASTIDTTRAGASAAGANISFSNTINGARNLTLNAGTGGTITFANAVGNSTALTNLIFTGANLIQIGNNIRVSGANPLTFPYPVSLTGDSTITTTNNTVTFSSTVDGTQALTVAAGTGAVSFSSPVGGTTSLTDLTVTTAGATTFNALTLSGALTQTNAATGATTFNGAVSVGSADLSGTTFSVGNSFTSSGAVTVTNSDTFTKTALGTIAAAGGFSTSGATSLANNVSTTNTALTIGGTLSLGAGSISLSSGTGDLTISGTTSSAGFSSTLTLTGGTVSLAAMGSGGGTDLKNLTFTNCGTITFNAALNITGLLSQTTPATGTTTFLDTVAVGSAALQGTAFNINNSWTSTGSTAITNSGTVTKTNTGAIVASGGFSTSSTTDLASDITTSGGAISLGALTLSASVTLDTTNAGAVAAGANITFNSSVNGAQSLVANGGTGGIVTLSPMGTTTPLTGLTVTGGSVRFTGNITTGGGAVSITGPTRVNTTTTISTTSGVPAGANVTFSTFSTSGFGTIDGNTTSQGLIIQGGSGGVISFGPVGSTGVLSNFTARGLTVNQNGTVSTVGTVFYTGTANIAGNITTRAGTIQVPAVNLTAANVVFDTTNGGGLPSGNPITVNGSLDGAVGGSSLTLLAGTGGSITLNTVGGTTPLNVLTITNTNNVTAGAISAASIVQTTGAGTTTFNGALNTTGSGGIVLTGNAFTVNANITTTNGGPLSITHSGTLTYAAGVALSISGTYTDAGTGSTVYSGGINITTSGQNITFNRPLVLNGASSFSTGTGVGNILFASTLDGAQNLSLGTNLGNITFSGGVGQTTPLGAVSISSANNVTANAFKAASYSQSAGSGTTTLNGAVVLSGATGFVFTGNNLTINNTLSTAATGPATISVAGTLILSSSAALSLDGAFTQSGAGTVQSSGSITTTNDIIQFGSTVVLTGASTFNSAGNDISFQSTIDGPGALTLTAGAGNITFTGNAGGATRLGTLLINSCTNFSTQNITATSIQLSSTGTASMAALNTSTAGGIQLTGNTMNISGALTTTNGGSCTITNSGVLTEAFGTSSLNGSYTQNGLGAVSASGSLSTTNNGNISFLRAVTLTSGTTLSAGGTGTITFSSTVDGTSAGSQNLTLSSGGSTTLSGALGGTVRLGNVTFSSSAGVTAQAITAASLTQSAGTGTTTFNGAINTNTLTGISLVGTNITFNAGATTTAAGPIAITNSGVFTLSSGIGLTAAGSFTETGTGTNTLAGTITSGGTLSFARPITSNGSTVLSTAAANQNITLFSTVAGPGNLTLAAGTGNITLSGIVGGTTALGNLTIGSVNSLSTLAITASTITQSAGTTSQFTGGLTTSGSGGISITGTTITINGAIQTTNGGGFTLNNSGTFTSNSGAATTVDGAYLQSGAGPVLISGVITTNNQNITFNGPLTLSNNISLNSGAGAGNITLNGTVNGAFNTTLAAGTGSITLASNIGATTPIGTFTISSANNVSTQAITAASIVQSAGTGTSTFNGDLTTSTVGGVSLNGNIFSLQGQVTTALSGPVVIVETNGLTIDGALTVDGAFTQTGSGTVSLGASITTNNQNISFAAPVNLVGSATLNTGSGAGSITFGSTIDGSQALTLTAGGDNVTITGAIGSTTPLIFLAALGNSISLGNIGGASSGITSGATLTATSLITLSGTTYNYNTQNYSAPTINFTAGALTTMTSSNTAISFTATSMQLFTGTNLAINSNGGAITLSTLDAVAGDLRSVTLNAGTGNITLSSIGTAASNEFASLAFTGGNISLRGELKSTAATFTPSGTVFLGGSITTTGTALVFSGPVVRDTSTGATLTTAGGDITFQSTLDGDADNTRNLTLAPGTGNITFTGAVGATHPLNALTIASATNVTANAITADHIIQSSGTGTTTFNGALNTSGVLGISLTGNAFTFNNTVTTTNSGGLIITNAGLLTMSSGATLSLNSVLTQQGSGNVSLANSTTAADAVSFASPITLNGPISISTAANGRSITFSSSIDSGIGGPYDITLAAGTGNINFLAPNGSNGRLGAMTITSSQDVTQNGLIGTSINVTSSGTNTSSGVSEFNGAAGVVVSTKDVVSNGQLTASAGPITVTVTGTASGIPTGPTTAYGDITTNSSGIAFSGGETISLTGNIYISFPVTLAATSVYDTSGGNGNITFASTINGANDMYLNAGTGNITFLADVGTTTKLTSVNITSAGNVTTQAITANLIYQAAGTGTTTFNGALTTNTAIVSGGFLTPTTGISITTKNVTRGSSITTLNGGGLTITLNDGGLFTSTAAGAISLDGSFTQNDPNSTAAVTISGSISTNAADISFASPVTMQGDLALDTGSGLGDIIFGSTIQGAYALTMNARTGNIVLNGDVGTSLAPIGALTLTRATDITTQDIYATTITQGAGQGTSTYGRLSTNALGGIALTGTNFMFNGSLTTTNAGPLSVSSSGLATYTARATGSISSTFTQTGAASLINSMTTGGAILFGNAVTLAGVSAYNSTNNLITFSSTVDGSGTLTLTSGTNDILFSGVIGGTTPTGALTIASARNVTFSTVTADSIAQNAGTGTTTFNSTVTTSGSAGIQLTGSAFTLLGNATTTNSGPITFVNSGVLTFSNGISISSSGAFSQSGGGTVSTGASIATAQAPLSFANAVTLTAASVFSTGTGGNITLATVDGNQTLGLTAGTGDITLTGAIGGTTRIGALTVNSCTNFTSQALTVASFFINETGGTATFNGDLNTNAPAGITLNVNNIFRGGGFTATNGGPLTTVFTGTITGATSTPITVGSASTTYGGTGTGLLNFRGTVIATTGGIVYNTPINLIAAATFDSSQSGGNIVFSSTIDGTQNLTLVTGAGNIQLNGALGSTTPLSALTFTSATNTTTGSISAASITATSITGQGTFGALTTSGSSGISLTGNNLMLNGNVTTTGTGPLSVALTGTSPLTIGTGIAISLDGAFAQTGTGNVVTGGSITTTNDAISFASPVTLTGAVALNSGAGIGNITFSQTINGAFGLSVAAGTGDVSFGGSVGQVTAPTGITITSGNNLTISQSVVTSGLFSSTVTGLTTLNGTIASSSNGIQLTTGTMAQNASLSTTNGGLISIVNSGAATLAAAINSSSSFQKSGGGTVSLGANVTTAGQMQFGSAISLTNPITLNTSNNALNLLGTVNGAQNLTLIAGTGSITCSSAIGGTTPLSNFTITSANAVTTAAISASTIAQTNGTGLTRFGGALSTTGATGITLNGAQFQFDGSVTTTNSGKLSVVHTGNLTISNAVAFNLDGLFTGSGGGSVFLGGNITTTNDNISWSGPITLTHDSTLNTGAGAGNITFASTVDGPYCLTLNSGTGTVQFLAPLGATIPLNCLGVTGASILQPTPITTATTVSLTGLVNVGANITTTNSDITITGSVIRDTTNSVTFSTGSGAGNINITGTVNGDTTGRSLTLNAGTGTVTLGNTVGGNIPLQNFSVSGSAISMSNLGRVGSSGSTGTTSLTATSSITFTGTNYNNGTQIYTAGTNFNVTSGATTTFTSSNLPITFNTGTIALSSLTNLTLNSNGGNITLSDVTGAGSMLTANANVGTLTYANVGTSADPLDTVTFTANTFSGTPANVYANTFTLNSPSVQTINSNILSPGTALVYNAPILVDSSTPGTTITFSTCDGMGGGAAITFNQTVDATTNVSSILLDACGSAVTFNAPVGGINPPTQIVVDNASDLGINSTLTAGSFIQNSGSGTTTIAGQIETTDATGINLQTANIVIEGTTVTTNNGPLVLNNSGTLTIVGAALNIDGPFTQSGAGSVSMAGSLTTTDDAVSFAGPITLTGDMGIDNVATVGANITFSSTIDGAGNLTLTAGTGNVNLMDLAGGTVRLSDVSISANDITTSDVTASSILVAATGITTFNGALNTNTLAGIVLGGDAIALNGNVTTTANGPLLVTNAGTLSISSSSVISVSGAISQLGTGAVTLGGSLTSDKQIAFASTATISNPTTLNTATNSTNITFSNGVNGTSSLSMDLGSGNLDVVGNLGDIAARLGAVTFTNVGDATLQNVNAASFTQTAGSGVTTVNTINTNAIGGVSLAGTNFTINGDIITTGSGPVAITNSGVLSLTAGSNTSITGAFTQSGGGTVALSGPLHTTNTNISFANPVTLQGSTDISSGAGAGNITFSSTVDGAQNLTLTAGTGNLLFSGNVGTVSRLNTLSVVSATDVTYQQARTVAMTQTSSGTTTIANSLDALGSAGIVLSSGTITQTGSVTTSNSGPVTFTISNAGSYTKTGTILSDGVFTQNGTGAVSLTGSITTTSDNISFAGPITLAGAASLSAGSGGSGNIVLSSTVDGAQNLTVVTGTGNITFSGAIGSGTRIGALTINSAQNVTATSITAASITQNAGTGTTQFNGTLNTNGISGIAVAGNNITFNNTVTTTNTGSVAINNTGTLTLGSSANFSVAGAFSQSTSAPVSISCTIAAGGAVTFNGPCTIPTSQTATINTSSNGTAIQFNNTLNGPGSANLTLGAGSLLLTQNAGATTPLNTFSIVSAANVTAQSLNASSITQSAGSGLTKFNSDITASGSGGISLTGTAITFAGNATSSGPLTIVNSGALTTQLGKTYSSTGVFSQSGGGSVSLAGTVVTANQDLSFANAVTLTAPVTLNSGSGAGSISFGSTIDGAQPLTITAGTGDFSAAGNIGSTTRLGAVTFVSGHNVTIQAMTAASLNQQSGTGTSLIVGNLNTNTPAGITLVGNNFTRTGSLITTNGGSVHVTNSGSILGNPANTTSIDGSYTIDGTGGVNFAGTVTTLNGKISFLAPVSMLGDGTLNSSASGAGVEITGPINGAHALTVTAGAGNVSITQDIGNTTALTGLTITGDILTLENIGGASPGVSGTTSLTSLNNIIFNGTTYNAATQTYNAVGEFTIASGAATSFSSNGSNLTFQNGTINLMPNTNLTLSSSGGALTTSSIRASTTSGRSLTLASGSGNLSVGAIGIAGGSEFSSISLSGNEITLNNAIVGGTIALTPATILNVGGDITATNTPLSFPTAVTLLSDSVISTGFTGDITFSGIVDGSTADAQNLTLSAGGGNIVFAGTVGSTSLTRPNLITIYSANNVTIGDMNVDGYIQYSGLGTTTITGNATIVNNIGLQITSTLVNIPSGAVLNTEAGSSITINNSNLLTLAGTVTPDGSFVQAGTGTTTLSGSITTNSGGISFVGPVQVSGTPTLNSSANNQPVVFSSTLNGPGNITITSGSGDISLLADAGTVTALGDVMVPSSHDIKVQNFVADSLTATSNGTMRLQGSLTTQGSVGIDLTGLNFIRSGSIITTNGGNFVVTNSGSITGTSINTTSIDGSYTQNGTGPVFFAGLIQTNNSPISFSSPITMLAPGGFNSGSGAGDITLQSTIDGPFALQFIAGTGSIHLNGALGGTNALGNVLISSATNVTASSSIAAASLTQAAGSGTSTFSGAITTNGSGGINLTGTNIIRGAAWTTSGLGGITVANTGTFTSTASGDIQAIGAFSQSGTGAVSLGGNVRTSNANISFAGPITLASGVLLSSGTGAGAITISNTVNGTTSGSQSLTLNSGADNITVTGSLGATTPLNVLSIPQTASANFASINATSIQQTGGSGTTTFSGTVNTSGVAGIVLAGNAFAINGSVTTTANGPLTISNAGPLTITSPCTISGAFSQTAGGTSTLSNTLTSNNTISFAGAVATTGSSASLSTSNFAIVLSSTLDGPGDITLNAGTSTISLQGAGGSTTRLGAVTFAHASDIFTKGIAATSITQTTATGTTQITGNLDTSGSSGIHLTGVNFTINGALTSTNGGPCSLSHTGLLTLNVGVGSLLSGPFTESGTGGTVSFSGDLHATNSNVSFANPITLTGAAVINSNEGGDILISSPVDGAYDLVYTAGTGNITLAADIGSTTPVNSLTITSANDTSTQNIFAGTLTQNSGTGTTTFNGTLTTSLPAGISLTGNAFSFLDAVTTTNGTFTIANTGTVTLPSTALVSAGGTFTQSGSGNVLLGTTIEVASGGISFAGPITLTNDVDLDVSASAGPITLSNSVDGAHTLTLNAGTGVITASGNIGSTTPLTTFDVTGASNFTSQGISAATINIQGITDTATFNGPLISTSGSGITLSGASITINGDITTTNGGPLSITTTSVFTLSPTATITPSGSFTQTGTGSMSLGGAIITNGDPITFNVPIFLTGDLLMNSNNGAITITDEVEGSFALTLTAGTGNVTVTTAIGISEPFTSVTISGQNISLNGVGSTSSIISGALTLTAIDHLTLGNTTYAAHSQTYQAGPTTIEFTNPGLVTLYSNGGDIIFTEPVLLDTGTDLLIETNGGTFSFLSIEGTTFENVTIDTGSGLASLGTVTSGINTITVTAGSILLNGPISDTNTSFTSQTSILNAGSPVNIQSQNTAFFNAVNGNVGSFSSPILVNTSNQIIAGAADLADFNGSSIDNTVNSYPLNPPCEIIFNGVILQNCHPAPTPPSPSSVSAFFLRGFPGPWMESSFYNLASDYFFLPHFFTVDDYLRKDLPIYVYTRDSENLQAVPAVSSQNIYFLVPDQKDSTVGLEEFSLDPFLEEAAGL